MDKIAVLIPCYNEEKTIGKVCEDFRRVLPEAVIYVYDNNSTDRTAEIAREAGAVVRHEYMQGKGNVIRRMFRDIMTGYRAFSYNFVKTFPIMSKGFEIETEMSIHTVDKNMSIAFFIPVMGQYLHTGLVPRIPTLMVCGFTMIAAIQSFFAGLQLQIMVQKNRQDFEMHLHRVNDHYKKLMESSCRQNH